MWSDSDLRTPNASAPWYVGAEKSVSFGELAERTRKLAGVFARAKLEPGARVLLATSDDEAAATIFVACLRIGVVPLLVDPGLSPAEGSRIVAHCEPEGIIADDRLIDGWRLTAKFVLPIRPAKAGGRLVDRLLGKKSAELAWPALLSDTKPEALPPVPGDDALAYVLFTSGTTSSPKGVEITQGAVRTHVATLAKQFRYRPGARLLDVLPLHHVDGMIHGPVMTAAIGCTLHRPVTFSPQTVPMLVDRMHQARVTHVVLVPTLLSLLLRLGEAELEGLEGLELVISTGSALDEALWARGEAVFGVEIANFYGMTETVTGGVFCGPGPTRRLGTIGKPVDCEARVIDAEGRALAPGEAGELQLRGPNVMRGYHRNPEETAKVLRDGWMSTGDLATVDGDGFFRIVGRKKSLIIVGGKNVVPEEVSAALLEHPEIREAVTFGVADAEWGERVHAAVVTTLDDQAIVEHLRPRLAPFKIPTSFVRMDALPRGPAGKVLLEKVKPSARAPGGSVEERVLDIAARVFRAQRSTLGPRSAPEDTPGWDSRAHLDFVVELERELSIRLSAKDVMAIDCLERAVTVASAQLSAR